MVLVDLRGFPVEKAKIVEKWGKKEKKPASFFQNWQFCVGFSVGFY